MAGDDPQDDGERTRIGGPPPGVPRPSAAAPAPAAAPEDPGERTTIAPARPPGLPATAPVGGQPFAPGDEGERTTIAPARPPGLPAAAGAAAPGAQEAGDRTQVIASPPPGAARAVPPSAAPAKPAASTIDATLDPAGPRTAQADDEERTVVLAPRPVESTLRLVRVAPKGIEETIRFDRPSLVLGRGHGCDVKLRTPTASREHAKVFVRDGQWMIAGVEGKTFHADGTRRSGGEVVLKGGMKLRLGDDEFEVVDTAEGATSRSGGGLWARVAAFVRGLFGRRT